KPERAVGRLPHRLWITPRLILRVDVGIGSIGKGDGGLRTFSKFRAERLDASDMLKAGLNETCETLEAVRIDCGTRCNVPGKYWMIVLALKSGITFMRTRPEA